MKYYYRCLLVIVLSWLSVGAGLIVVAIGGAWAQRPASSAPPVPLTLAGREGATVNRQVKSRAPRWEADHRLTFDPGASRITFNFARSVAADGSGRVHAVWYDARRGAAQVYYKRSDDDGKTWGADTQLSQDGAVNEHPSITASGSSVFVVWHGMSSGGVNVRLRRSTDGGTTWEPEVSISHSGSGAHASVAVSGAWVHLVWGDTRSREAEVYYRRSTDGGKTWEAERRLTDVPFASWVPSLAAAGNLVVLAWVDTRDGNEEEYVKVSRDGGVTWGADTRLTNNRMNSWAPSVAIVGNTVHLVWFDQKDNPLHSNDAEKRLDEAMRLVGLEPEPIPEGVLVPHPEEAAKRRATEKLQRIQREAPGWVARGGDAAKLQAIMQEFERMSKPSTALIIAAEKELDEAMKLVGLAADAADEAPAPGADAEALRERIEAKVKRFHEAVPGWVARGGEPAKVQAAMQRFEEAMRRVGGASYAEKEKKLDEALKLMNLSYIPGPLTKDVPKTYYGDAQGMRVQSKMRALQKAAPAWVQRGGDPQRLETLLKEFHRMMETATKDWDIYYRRSDDGGKTWGAETRLTTAPGASTRPNIAVAGNDLHVVWFDNRDGNFEVYHKASSDGGKTWTADHRLTDSPGDSQHPTVALSHGFVHVLWFDQRDGNHEIYYKRAVR